MKPVRVLKMMVDRWREAADAAGLEEKAAELGKTPGELMIIASLIEAEGRGDDMPKISRVIYNRLDGPGDKGGTNGDKSSPCGGSVAASRSGTGSAQTVISSGGEGQQIPSGLVTDLICLDLGFSLEFVPFLTRDCVLYDRMIQLQLSFFELEWRPLF